MVYPETDTGAFFHYSTTNYPQQLLGIQESSYFYYHMELWKRWNPDVSHLNYLVSHYLHSESTVLLSYVPDMFPLLLFINFLNGRRQL